MFDPIELSEKIEKEVCKGEKRKYYRFRATGFYGGIATADVVGCNLRCKFCWSGKSVWNPSKTGRFFSPKEVAKRLQSIAEEKNFIKIRISGGEPTIGKKHLISLLEEVPQNLLFILETNGILLGADSSYVRELSRFRNLHVRVSLKGCDEKEFNLLTGAKGFKYQLKSLEYLKREKVSFNIALVSIKKDRNSFFKELIEMGLGDVMIEEEQIKLYPSVKRRLYKTNLLHYFDYRN